MAHAYKCSASLFFGTKAAVGAHDFVQDVVGLCSPGEGFRIFIMQSDVLVNRGNQFRHAL